jgi:uncharacterized membrane protein
MNLSQTDKNGIYVLSSYYVLALAAVVYFVKSGNFKSGPCNPGLDFVSIFLFLLISFILLIISIYKTIKNREKKYLLFINIVAIALVFLLASI